jgi:transcriptional regulator with XRE-family HTH domain
VTNHLGGYFKERRGKRGLGLGQLARLLGYRNVSKGSNRIARFERGGAVTEDLLLRLAEALGIDLATVEGLLEEDRQERLREWEAWVNEPVPMRLIVRYMPAVYGRVALPEGVTTPEQAEWYACAYGPPARPAGLPGAEQASVGVGRGRWPCRGQDAGHAGRAERPVHAAEGGRPEVPVELRRSPVSEWRWSTGSAIHPPGPGVRGLTRAASQRSEWPFSFQNPPGVGSIPLTPLPPCGRP